MLGGIRRLTLSQLHEARQPDFDSDGSHSNAYWQSKSANAIRQNRWQVCAPCPSALPKCHNRCACSQGALQARCRRRSALPAVSMAEAKLLCSS
jgi:hypothetical protein